MQNRQIVNRYDIIDELGHGAMGTVYRVYDRLERTDVALKQVSISPSNLMFGTQGQYKSERLALANEFKVLAGLRHPHIVSVLDYGFDECRGGIAGCPCRVGDAAQCT